MMECNKEEAIRAKDIAEKKMQNKDFLGARKIALRAQQLHPELENISQLITVCDVHCSAENNGNEKDWYGILKVEPTADEALVKKQYRKFALLLHPDKNKFPGASDAFKLIGEAQGVLLDRGKRMQYDRSKATRRAAPNWATQPGSSNFNFGKQPPWQQNHFASKASSPFMAFNSQYQQPARQTQQRSSNDRMTFWTVCPFCSTKYQFYRELVNRLLSCDRCKRPFTAYEISPPVPGTNRFPFTFSQTKEVPNQGDFKANVQGASANPASKVGSQGNIISENHSRTTEIARESKPNEKRGNVDAKINKEGGFRESKSSGKINGKRKKQAAESSESSCDTESSSDPEEDILTEENSNVAAKQNFVSYGGYPRRSTRSKQHVSYSENLSEEDELGGPLKRAKCNGSYHDTEVPVSKKEAAEQSTIKEGRIQNVKEESEVANKVMKDDQERSSIGNVKSSSISSPIKETDPEVYEYPDPDFNDFDKDRREGCFAVGQIWAVYDTLDAMPRFYARIRKVHKPGFKLRITWLEPDPDDEDEIKWVDEGLPVTCGKFKHGKSENTEDQPMFSHLVHWEKGSKRDTYKIYPRKGQTWALFKNWDIKWHAEPGCERKYEFEFVEVLSDFTEGIGVAVAYLSKVKGFSCLFCRTAMEGKDSILLQANQLLRFSHRVPSFKMTGEERKNVPKGSFELDPASLSANLPEVTVAEDSNMEDANIQIDDISCSESPTGSAEPVTKSEENTSELQVNKIKDVDVGRISPETSTKDPETQFAPEHMSSDNCSKDTNSSLPSMPKYFEVPDPEFYNFDDDKLPEKFQIGQIWALYSDEDGLPKYYALVKKIENLPEFKLHMTWLVACSMPENAISWLDKDMLIGCGMFKPQKGTAKYTETSAFSHQLRVERTDKKDVYAIFPGKGDVWALYRNWNSGITSSDLETCDYDMVEILEVNESAIKVLVLELVDGFNSVFKAEMGEGSALVIARTELLRFSHQVPAFRLTDQRGGSLRGFWELDPAALPIKLFSST
ncbi:uncharacterized protein LOC127799548 [Diospyros lotus]|uniref:uncharacterized protein LOC127799548 n=1 Tax=Diospyros lotus TaxID=55363 RepID=UPI0022568CBF|nr:uncharacterized protein LOC127799548 [Diospyros lotus]